MEKKVFIPPEDFAQVVRNTPLVSIDLILRDQEDFVLIGHRFFEPAKGMWFVPGGRIGKDETLDEAFSRILHVETGLDMRRGESRFLGVYEHFYTTNRFEDPSYDTHYVVLGHEIRLKTRPQIRLDNQHTDIRWMSVADLLQDPQVHENTKAYFRISG